MQRNKQYEYNYEVVQKTRNDHYYITIDKEERYGIINDQKQVLLQNVYLYLEYLYKDYFIASNDKGYLGIIDISGQTLVDFHYEVIQKVGNSDVIEAKILKEGITKLFSNNLEQIYTKENVTVYSYNDYIEVISKEETKYFDFEGNERLPQQVCKGNLYAKKENGKWGLVDGKGNVIVDFIYDRTTSQNEYGFAGINKDDKWGVVDEKGNILIEPTYKIENGSKEPEFIGVYYKVYYGYGESYYTNYIKD